MSAASKPKVSRKTLFKGAGPEAPNALPRLVNPALVEHARQRRESLENRVADRITAFSGSMRFVYLHMIWFTCWIAFGVEPYPYGLLTMIVSLEAIFLSTFVMITQNRELLLLSNEILQLTKALHGASAVPEAASEKSSG